MAGNYLNFPFDEEIFLMTWNAQTDPVKTELLRSGAVVEDATIAGLISNGSDFFTAPYYKLIGGTPANYDGATDIPTVDTGGDTASGIVFGRTQGWAENAFVRDYNSGANPMGYIASQVASFWDHYRQNLLLKMLDGISQVPGMESHVIDTGAPVDDTALGDAVVDAIGDNSDAIGLAFMHSKVANQLANRDLLYYAKYTDPQGIERQNRKIAYVNGILVVVDDSAPHTAATGSGAAAKPASYTTFLLGSGFIRHAVAPVEVPVEVQRDPQTNGGMNYLYTRIRECYHPNGFSFAKPKTGYTASPTDAQLADKANWTLKADPKTVPFVAVKTQA